MFNDKALHGVNLKDNHIDYFCTCIVDNWQPFTQVGCIVDN